MSIQSDEKMELPGELRVSEPLGQRRPSLQQGRTSATDVSVLSKAHHDAAKQSSDGPGAPDSDAGDGRDETTPLIPQQKKRGSLGSAPTGKARTPLPSTSSCTDMAQRLDNEGTSLTQHKSVQYSLRTRTDPPETDGDGGGAGYLSFLRWRVIQPTDPWLWAWWLVVSAFAVYNALAIPMRVSFRQLWSDHPLNMFFNLADYSGDLLFLADILVRFRVAVVSEGMLVETKPEIEQQYRTSVSFVMHVLASLPIDVFVWSGPGYLHPLLRCLKLLRIGGVLRLLQDWEVQTASGTFVRLGKLFAGCLILIHWIACSYFAMVYFTGFGDGPDHWAPPENVRERPLGAQYLWAIYFAVLTVFETGVDHPAPETDAQRGFTIVLGFICVFFVALIIGFVADMIAELNQTAEEFRNRMKSINELMENRSLPEDLKLRVRRYCFHQWSRKGAFESESGLDELPCNLRASVSDATYGEIIRKVPLFQVCDPKFVALLTQSLTPRIYAPGDMIVEFDEDAQEMFFLNQGHVEILSATGALICVLGEGSVIGEIAFFLENSRRTASVRAKTWCDFVTLERGSFEDICEKYPEQYQLLANLAHARIATDLLRNKLKEHEFMVDIPTAALQAIIKKFEAFEVTPNAGAIYNVGDPCDSWLFVGMGRVKLFKPKSVDKPIDEDCLVEEVEAGGFLSSVQLFFSDKAEAERRRELCEVEKPATIMGIDHQAMHAILSAHGCLATFDRNVARAKGAHKARSRQRFSDAIHKVKNEVMLMDLMGFMSKHKGKPVARRFGDIREISRRIDLAKTDFQGVSTDDLVHVQKKLATVQMVISEVLLDRLQTVTARP